SLFRKTATPGLAGVRAARHGIAGHQVLGLVAGNIGDAIGPRIVGLRTCAALTPRGAAQAAIQIGMRILQVADDLEIDALYLRQIDLLDMDEPKQLAHGLRHFAPAFVARTAALRNADLRPELLLVKTQAPADFARIQHSVE